MTHLFFCSFLFCWVGLIEAGVGWRGRECMCLGLMDWHFWKLHQISNQMSIQSKRIVREVEVWVYCRWQDQCEIERGSGRDSGMRVKWSRMRVLMRKGFSEWLMDLIINQPVWVSVEWVMDRIEVGISKMVSNWSKLSETDKVMGPLAAAMGIWCVEMMWIDGWRIERSVV